ncbi:MAG: hypothetical protein AB7K63_14230 [Vicinamibacterales bacterium]
MTTSPLHDADGLGPALRQDLDTVAARATVPSATAVWFRAERRARLDALKQAERPIWFAERMALVGAGVGIGWLGTLARDWLGTHDLVTALATMPVAESLTAGGVTGMTLGALVLGGLALGAGILVVRSVD